jgi:hypothetical protein
MTTPETQILELAEQQFAQAMASSRHSIVKSRFANFAVADPPAPAAGTPDPASLTNILNSVVTAPATSSVASVPSTPDTMMYQLLAQIQTLDSYIQILTAFCLYNDHPAPYDITDPVQATQFTQAMAKWRNYVTTGGTVKALAAFLPVGEISTQTMSKNVTTVDLHADLLSSLFGGFGFSPSTMNELDSILTNLANSLADLSMKFESASETVDHFLTYYYFGTVQGTGGENQPPALYDVKLRTFYLHIDQSSWKASLGKSTVTEFSFNMNWFQMDTTMNSTLVAANMDAINSSIQTLSGQDATAINKLMNMKAVHADPQPA